MLPGIGNTLKNVKLKTYSMPLSATVVCLNISMYRLYKPFHSTSIPKLTTGYNTVSMASYTAKTKTDNNIAQNFKNTG